MKFKTKNWKKWNWVVSLERRRAKKAADGLDALFPLCYVPE